MYVTFQLVEELRRRILSLYTTRGIDLCSLYSSQFFSIHMHSSLLLLFFVSII